MPRSYLTKDGDVLDAICHEFYGSEDVVTQVLDVNVHLADMGPVLSAGVEITLPDVEVKQVEAQEVTLWS